MTFKNSFPVVVEPLSTYKT